MKNQNSRNKEITQKEQGRIVYEVEKITFKNRRKKEEIKENTR